MSDIKLLIAAVLLKTYPIESGRQNFLSGTSCLHPKFCYKKERVTELSIAFRLYENKKRIVVGLGTDAKRSAGQTPGGTLVCGAEGSQSKWFR